MSIKAENIIAGYGDKVILDKLSCAIEDKKINVVIGKNGSGKSTLFKVLCRQLKPKEGVVTLNDINFNGLTQIEFAKQIAILFQENPNLSGLTVRDLVSYGRYAYTGLMRPMSEEDKVAVDKALEITKTFLYSNTDISELSSGQRQMAYIAMLAAQESKYMFLDEPTTFLDLKNQFDVLDCLKNLKEEFGKTVIMILHDLNLAFQYADNIIMMKNWGIIHYGKKEEMLKEEYLEETFDTPVKVIKTSDGNAYCIPARDKR